MPVIGDGIGNIGLIRNSGRCWLRGSGRRSGSILRLIRGHISDNDYGGSHDEEGSSSPIEFDRKICFKLTNQQPRNGKTEIEKYLRAKRSRVEIKERN